MKTNKIYIIDSFTHEKGGGNPAGLMILDEPITEELMQNIAGQVNISETAFVEIKREHYRIHFYTPTRRIANCGHATVAAFGYMKKMGLISTSEIQIENDLGDAKVYFTDDSTFLSYKNFRQSSLNDHDVNLLQSKSTSIKTEPSIVSYGNNFVLLEVKSEKDLINFKLPKNLMLELSERYDLVGFYAYWNNAGNIFTRMFAPAYGISEESATGMAAAPLFTFLQLNSIVQSNELTINQGYHMKPIRKSQILCKVIGKELLVGGGSILNSIKEINL